jgi:predicted nucleotide-binding protein (sugar kinase/HSP70/actin superfamily)
VDKRKERIGKRRMSESKFKGWGIKDMKVKQSTFNCKDKKCGIGCQVNRITTEDGEKVFFGDRCERYTTGKSVKPSEVVTLLDQRNEELARTKTYVPGQPTIGVPRASLNLGGVGAFAISFLENIGFNIVVSDETNETIKKRGVAASKSNFCFPIKVAYGHILDLVDKEVNFIWMPSYHDMPKTAFRKSHVCPWIQGLPDSTRVALHDRLNDIPLLTPRLHFREEKRENLVDELYDMLTRDLDTSVVRDDLLQRIEDARHAQLMLENRWLNDIGKRFVSDAARRKDGKEYFVLVGRPYNSCDPGMTFRLSKILDKYGVVALPMDMFPGINFVTQNPKLRDNHPNMYYAYGQKILALADLLKNDDKYENIFPVYCTSFNCGPDAFIIPLFDNELEGKSCLRLSFDEQSGEAHTVTRVEAFIDSLQGIRKMGKMPKKRHMSFPIRYDIENEEDTKRTVLLTPMDYGGGRVLRSLFEASGIKTELVRQRTRDDLNKGLDLSREDQCFPCAETFSHLLREIDERGPEACAMFQGGAEGPCRYGLYEFYQAMMLSKHADDVGNPEIARIPFHTLNAETGYAVEGMPGVMKATFSGTGYSVIRTADHLKKSRNIIRMRELTEGDADQVFRECLDKLCAAVEALPHFKDRSKDIRLRDFYRTISTIVDIARESGEQFSRIPIDASKPLIKIIGDGEIFVRLYPPSNKFIEDYFRKHHGQLVEISPLCYWLDATDYFYIEELKQNQDWKAMRPVKIKMAFKQLVGHAIDKAFRKVRDFYHTADVRDIINAGKEVFRCGLKGEAVITVGGIDLAQKEGYHGALNLFPSTCMPGTLVDSLIPELQRRNPGFPIKSLAFDASDPPNHEDILDGFAYQVRKFYEKSMREGRKPHEHKETSYWRKYIPILADRFIFPQKL